MKSVRLVPAIVGLILVGGGIAWGAALTIGSPAPVYVVPLTSNGNGTATDGSRTYTIGSPAPVYVVPLTSNGNGTAADGGNTLTVGSRAPIYVVPVTTNGNGTATDGGNTLTVGSPAPIYVVPITGNGNGTATDGGRTYPVGSPAPVYVVNLQSNGNGSAADAPVADVALNFVANTAVVSGVSSSATSLLTVTRAGTAYADDLSGNWTSFAANAPRQTNKGLLIEETRANVALWARDLTNAAWVRTSVTAALNVTGIDGTANAATTLTASGANGTVLQAITLASSARMQSAFVRRVTGTGEIDMTTDGGSTWVAVTPCAAGTALGLCRVSIPSQTVTNPSVGFRIVTSGDVIAVDFVQNEAGTFVTSPILTLATLVTRAADGVRMTTPPALGSAYTFYVAGTPMAPIPSANVQPWLSLTDNSVNNRAEMDRNSATGALRVLWAISGTPVSVLGSSIAAQNVPAKVAGAFQAGDQSGCANGGAIVSQAVAGLPVGLNKVVLGSNEGNIYIDGYITQVGIWATQRLPNAVLINLTAP